MMCKVEHTVKNVNILQNVIESPRSLPTNCEKPRRLERGWIAKIPPKYKR